jgi:hypothetical protein
MYMRRRQKTILSFLVLSNILFSTASAQNVSATATVDSTSVALGDWINLRLEVKYPSNVKIYFPVIKDSLGPFDIVRQDSLLHTENNGVSVLSKIITLASFRDGKKYIPPITVSYRPSSDTTLCSVQSNPISVEVRTVSVDTSAALRDIKPPIAVPISAAEFALYAGMVIVFVLIMYFLYKRIRKKKRTNDESIEVLPRIPSHLLALQKLNELEAKRLWQRGEIKLFYSNATEIVREYFELRYGIMALEMTTGEVMQELQKHAIDHDIHNAVEAYLSHADLVKFAQYHPDLKENEDIIPHARHIIEKTKPIVAAGQMQEGVVAHE